MYTLINSNDSLSSSADHHALKPNSLSDGRSVTTWMFVHLTEMILAVHMVNFSKGLWSRIVRKGTYALVVREWNECRSGIS